MVVVKEVEKAILVEIRKYGRAGVPSGETDMVPSVPFLWEHLSCHIRE